MSDFGTRLKATRKQKKITQKELADALGVAQSTIANYETNLRMPSMSVLRDIADYLNVSADMLLSIKNEPSDQTIEKFDMEDFLELLIKGDENAASQMVLSIFIEGVSIIQIISRVFIPTLKRVGDLWEKNALDIAEEHFISSAIDRMLSLISRTSADAYKNKNYSALLMVPGAEEHTLVLKMVAEYFRVKGWRVFFLGKSIPLKSLSWMINRHKVDLLVLSVTMSHHQNSAESLIHSIKSLAAEHSPKIMVGGRAIKDVAYAKSFYNADYYATSIEQLDDVIDAIEQELMKIV